MSTLDPIIPITRKLPDPPPSVGNQRGPQRSLNGSLPDPETMSRDVGAPKGRESIIPAVKTQLHEGEASGSRKDTRVEISGGSWVGLSVTLAAISIILFSYLYWVYLRKKMGHHDPRKPHALKKHLETKHTNVMKNHDQHLETKQTNVMKNHGQHPRVRLPTLYVPQEGQAVLGKRRIFNTSKGIRIYHVDAANFPIKSPKRSQT